MSTETKCLTFLEVLRLKNVELWESKLAHFSLLGKGDLQLLFSHSLDLTVLKLNDNYWVLDKDLQVIGTRSIRGEWQAYSIVSPGGFLCLKITGLNFMSQQHPELVNFERIVESRSNFLRNASLESKFDLFKESQKSGLGNVTDSIMNVVHSITSTISHSDYTNHPNYQIVRPLEDLLSVDSTGVPVVDIQENLLNNYKTESGMLHEYQGQGEWKVLWDAGNNEYLHGFSKMSLSDSKSQGENIPQGSIIRSQTEQLGGQSEFQHGDLERIKSQSIGDQGYQQAVPGQHHHDAQEVVGGEQQRLPGYEVESSQHVPEGFKQASSNIQEGGDDVKQSEEDTEFTTGLLKNDIDVQPEIQPSPNTPYHINEQGNPPQELKPLSEQQEKIDLPKESLKLENWGSDITNPSETTPDVSDLKSDFRNADNRTNMEKINSESESLKETFSAP